MPRTPIDYSKTLIYKLVHKDDYDNSNVYIGSTTDFTRRKNEHKCRCNNEKHKSYNDKKYQYIRGNGGWDEWDMVLVERHNCNDGNDARSREEYWRSHFNAKLNIRRAHTTEEEKLEQHKEYYELNKDKKLEQMKEYYEQHKGQAKEYYKEYYEQHKDEILEQRKQKITCECGCIIRRSDIAKHSRTQNHINLLDAIPNNDIAF
jgi:hypothetical protein